MEGGDVNDAVVSRGSWVYAVVTEREANGLAAAETEEDGFRTDSDRETRLGSIQLNRSPTTDTPSSGPGTTPPTLPPLALVY